MLRVRLVGSSGSPCSSRTPADVARLDRVGWGSPSRPVWWRPGSRGRSTRRSGLTSSRGPSAWSCSPLTWPSPGGAGHRSLPEVAGDRVIRPRGVGLGHDPVEHLGRRTDASVQARPVPSQRLSSAPVSPSLMAASSIASWNRGSDAACTVRHRPRHDHRGELTPPGHLVSVMPQSVGVSSRCRRPSSTRGEGSVGRLTEPAGCPDRYSPRRARSPATRPAGRPATPPPDDQERPSRCGSHRHPAGRPSSGDRGAPRRAPPRAAPGRPRAGGRA